jgi:DNA-binding transcriptional regulator GbsR (MarR family)
MAKDSVQGIKDDIITTFGNVAAGMGMNRAHGLILGQLVFEKEGLNMKQLSKKTGYSLSTLSPQLKILENHGEVKCTKKEGVTHYMAVTSMEEKLHRAMERLRVQCMEPALESLSDAEHKLKSLNQTPEVRETLNIIKHLEAEYKKGMEMINMACEFHKRKYET